MAEKIMEGTSKQPEQISNQTDNNETQIRLQKLRQEFENAKFGEKYVWGMVSKLETGLLRDWDPQDKEYREIAEKINRLKNELSSIWQLTQDIENQIKELLWDVNNEIKKLSSKEKEVLTNIKNIDFLNIPQEKRLQYITKNCIDSKDISSWNIKNIDFTFTYDWKFNRDLYLKTTAWQVLPPEVGVVMVDWIEYNRGKNALKWEFFTQDNERLIIREWTDLKILSIRTSKEMEDIEKNIKLSLNNYSEKYKEDYELDIVTESLKRWIDPELTVLTFSDIFKNFPKDMDEKIKNATIEDLFTDFDRIRGIKRKSINEETWKYDSKLSLFMLFRFLWDSFSEKALNYWVSQQDIDDFNTWSDKYMAMEENSIQNQDSLPDWTFFKWNSLLENPEFANKLDKITNRIWANKEDLIKVMKAESWLNSRAINPISNATWLIQFMPSTAESLWTTVWELRKMSAVEQLDYVEKYFLANSNWQKLDSIEKLYQAVFYPLSLKKWPDFVFGSQNWTARLVASQNWVISKHSDRSDWFIDWHCFSKYVQNHVSKFNV